MDIEVAKKPDREFFVHLFLGTGAATLSVMGDVVGVAFCSPEERAHYNKSLGRIISRGRREAFAKGRKDTYAFKYKRDASMHPQDNAIEAFKAWLAMMDGGLPLWVWPDDPVSMWTSPRWRGKAVQT